MKIISNYYSNTGIFRKTNTKNPLIQSQSQSQTQSNPINENKMTAYQDYNISFKARLYRTPEDFYSQPFNQENMPDTVRSFLNEKYEERQHMPPSQLQREAFQYIKIADTVQEVKDTYPDEQLFKNLKSFDETRATHGILLLLRWDKQTSNTPVFKDKEEKDLALYLLKKVYIEGKTIEEINKDFEKESTDEIKKELGIKDGKYFSSSTLHAMGIKYPNLAYYNSFLATRNDKEYVPPVRKISEQPRTVSEDTKEKLRNSSKSWWAGLNETERAEQIQKMMDGKEFADSIFTKFQGPIMTIAAAKMGFSERLTEIFAEKYTDNDFNDDFSTFAEKQRAIMIDFWNKDPDFKENFTKVLNSIITDFEIAYNDKDNPEKLENLLNEALDLKAKTIQKAVEKRHQRAEMQKLAPKSPSTKGIAAETEKSPNAPSIDINSKKEITKLFRMNENASLRFFTDMFRVEFLDYITNRTDFKTKQQAVALNRPDAKELLNINDEQLEKMKGELKAKIFEIHRQFTRSNRCVAKTNDFVLAKFLYDQIKDNAIFKSERGDLKQLIQINKFDEAVLQNKNELNKQMKLLAKPLNPRDAKEFFESEFLPKLDKLLNGNFVHFPDINTTDFSKYKKALNSQLKNNPKFYNENIKFIQDYNAHIKFFKQSNDRVAKDTLFEHFVFDYLDFMLKRLKEIYNIEEGAKTQSKPNPSAIQSKENIPRMNVNMDSIQSLRNNFRFLSKKQTQFFSSDFEKKLVDFILSDERIDSDVLSAFIAIEIGQYDKMNLEPEGKKQVKEYVENTLSEINENFDKKYPNLTKANEFSLAETLYEQTGDINVFKNTRDKSVISILDNDLKDRFLNLKPLIDRKYNEYSKTLSDKEAQEFYENTLKEEINYVHKNRLKYHEDLAESTKKQAVSFLLKEVDEKEIINFIKNYTGAVKFVSDKNNPQEARDLLKEHIVYDFLCEMIPVLYTKKYKQNSL